MKQYVAVEWLHTALDEPIWLYYELDTDRHECRKVEEYRDGRMNSADARHGQGSTFLAWESHPSLAEINADPQFRAQEITAPRFEQIWLRATRFMLAPAAK
ncbi:MAG: DUF6881 domain-containing protein [Janthinobacterium lividum]